jgi:hypothetical protein
VAIWAAAWLEYPTADLALEGRDWQVELIARALAMGVLGVLVLAAAPRVIRGLRQAPRLLRSSRRPAAGKAAV